MLASIARWKALYFALAIVMWIHIVATTSIKTNVGVLLGALIVGAIHFGHVLRLLWKNALAIVIVAVAFSFAVVSNQETVASLERGANRVALGIEVLRAREELPGYTSFELRASWQREGFRGWTENPMFGHGVEAFRSKYGITSHASHVEFAYNSGLIGLTLFYGIFASIFLRLYRARRGELRNARLGILGGLVVIVHFFCREQSLRRIPCGVSCAEHWHPEARMRRVFYTPVADRLVYLDEKATPEFRDALRRVSTTCLCIG